MDLLEVYKFVVEAARQGGDVNKAVEFLNLALEAEEPLKSQILEEALNLAMRAVDEARWSMLYNTIIIITAIVFLVLALYNYKKILGFFFIKIYSKRRVIKGSGKPKTLLFDRDVAAVVSAFLVVASVILVGQLVKPIEPYMALGLLGPDEEIGNYPDFVEPGAPISLNVYVYNHMGRPVWLRITARYLDNITVEPSPHGFYVRELFLAHDKSVIIPLNFYVNKTGVLKVELWLYEVDGTLIYTNRSTYLMIRVK